MRKKLGMLEVAGESVGAIICNGSFTLSKAVRAAENAFENYDCRNIKRTLYYAMSDSKLVALIGCYKFKRIKNKFVYETYVIKHNKENEQSSYFDEDAYLNRTNRTWYEND
jgi:hypothetical protein